MVRTVACILLLVAVAAVIVLEAAGQRSSPKIRQCSMEQQKQYWTLMKEYFFDSFQEFNEQRKADFKLLVEDDTKMTECFSTYMKSMQIMMDCYYQKMSLKMGDTKEEIENSDYNDVFAKFMQKYMDKIHQQLMVMNPGQKLAFGTLFSDFYRSMRESFVKKLTQLDNEQKFSCEMKFTEEMMKPIMQQECMNPQIFKPSMEQMCSCVMKYQAKGAEPYCQTVRQTAYTSDMFKFF